MPSDLRTLLQTVSDHLVKEAISDLDNLLQPIAPIKRPQKFVVRSLVRTCLSESGPENPQVTLGRRLRLICLLV
jgi:hypothetical protein